MQSLFIPGKLQIDFIDDHNKPLHQNNILIGIRIFANYKNDIDLSPFLTDSNGSVTITAEDVKSRFDIFVSYGLMDYSSLETAKPEIEIYLWGNNSLNRYINYWTKLLEGKNDSKQFEMWGDQWENLQKEFAEIEKRERQELDLFTNCFNKTLKINGDKLLVKDNWNKTTVEIKYKVKLDLQ